MLQCCDAMLKGRFDAMLQVNAGMSGILKCNAAIYRCTAMLQFSAEIQSVLQITTHGAGIAIAPGATFLHASRAAALLAGQRGEHTQTMTGANVPLGSSPLRLRQDPLKR